MAALPVPSRAARGAEHDRPAEVREIPIGMRRAAAWSWRMLLVLAFATVVVYGLTKVATLLIPVLVALLVNSLMHPFASLIQNRLKVGRGLASGIALILLLVVVTGMFVFAGQQLVQQWPTIADKAVEGFDQALQWVTSTLHVGDNAVTEWTNKGIAEIKKNSGSIASGALAGVSTAGTVVTGILIALFTLFFLMKDGAQIWQWALRLMPRDARPATDRSFTRGWASLAGYMRTQVIVAAVDAVGIALGMVCVGLGGYAVPIWMIVFLMSFIPLVGAIVSGAVAILLALVLKGWVVALIMVGVVIAVQQIEGNVLQPFLMGKAVSLHPLAVFLGVAFGSMVAGIPGALFAIPVIAFANATILSLAGGGVEVDAALDDAAAVTDDEAADARSAASEPTDGVEGRTAPDRAADAHDPRG